MKKEIIWLFILITILNSANASITFAGLVDENGDITILKYDNASKSYADASLINPNIYLLLCADNYDDLNGKYVGLLYDRAENIIQITTSFYPLGSLQRIKDINASNCSKIDIDISSFKAVYPAIPTVVISNDREISSDDNFVKLNENVGWLKGSFVYSKTENSTHVTINVTLVKNDKNEDITIERGALVVELFNGSIISSGVTYPNVAISLDKKEYNGYYDILINGINTTLPPLPPSGEGGGGGGGGGVGGGGGGAGGGESKAIYVNVTIPSINCNENNLMILDILNTYKDVNFLVEGTIVRNNILYTHLKDSFFSPLKTILSRNITLPINSTTPPGNYIINLIYKDMDTGKVLLIQNKTFSMPECVIVQINNLTLANEKIAQNETQNISFEVENLGNINLTDLFVFIKINKDGLIFDKSISEDKLGPYELLYQGKLPLNFSKVIEDCGKFKTDIKVVRNSEELAQESINFEVLCKISAVSMSNLWIWLILLLLLVLVSFVIYKILHPISIKRIVEKIDENNYYIEFKVKNNVPFNLYDIILNMDYRFKEIFITGASPVPERAGYTEDIELLKWTLNLERFKSFDIKMRIKRVKETYEMPELKFVSAKYFKRRN